MLRIFFNETEMPQGVEDGVGFALVDAYVLTDIRQALLIGLVLGQTKKDFRCLLYGWNKGYILGFGFQWVLWSHLEFCHNLGFS